MKQITKTEKVLWGLIALSVIIMVFGFLFLFNAMGMASFYPHYAGISNVLAKYIVVILTMATGIMLFSNVAMRFPNKKVRNGLTIGITTFAFIMTIPLTYVLIALLPFAADNKVADVFAAAGVSSIEGMNPTTANIAADALGVNAIDKIMGTHNIYVGFADWFGEGALMWVVLAIMAVLGIVFLLEPLVAGICVTKGKLLQLFGKNEKGKFAIIAIVELPIVKKQRLAYCPGNCPNCEGCDLVKK